MNVIQEYDPRKYCHLCGRQWHPQIFCTCKARMENATSIVASLRDYMMRQSPGDPYILQELGRVLVELQMEHR